MVSSLKILTVLICSVSFFFLPSLSPAKEIIFGYSHFPPFICTDREHHSGIDIQLIREIGKRMGVSVVYKDYPFRRLLQYMKTGEIDIMTSLAKRPEREEFMIYLAPPYYSLGPTFYVKRGMKEHINKYEDLYNFQIGMMAASAFFEQFDYDQKISKHEANSELQLLKMVDAGRLDAFIGSNAQIDFLIRQNGFDNKIEKASFSPDSSTKIFLALSRKSPFASDITRLNNVLQDIIDEGMLEEFINNQCDY